MDSPALPSAIAVEQQIALLQRLAASLRESQTALLRMNLRDLEEHTGLQNALCGELKAWDKASRRSHGTGTQPESPGRQRWDDLQERLNAALEQVRYLNKVYAALLRRAQRSVQIMDNLLRNSSGSYIGRGAELCRVDSNEVRS